MRQIRRLLCSLFVAGLLAVLFAAPGVQAQTPAPEDVFGFEPGADYKMADYDQVMTYYRQLSEASDRVQLRDIGTTVLGRSMPLLLISSAENLDNLDRWREISETLARARIGEEESQFDVQFNQERGYPTRYTADFRDDRASQTVLTIGLEDSLGASDPGGQKETGTE